MFQDSAYICFSRLQHQKSRIQRKLFFQSCLQDPHEACYVLLSGDESCPVRAKTHHSDFQSLVCSHPSRGRNQLSRPVSFGTLSTPHRLFFGHNKHRRHQCCRGWLYGHCCSVYQLCRVQHRSCKTAKDEIINCVVFYKTSHQLFFQSWEPQAFTSFSSYSWSAQMRNNQTISTNGIVNCGFKSFKKMLIFR